MAQSYFDPDWTEKVTVPVRYVGNQWEFFYGGKVPVKDGALAELTLDAQSIANYAFLERVSQNLEVKVLPEGAQLIIAINDRSVHSKPVGDRPDIPRQYLPIGASRFERVTIGPPRPNQRSILPGNKSGGLWLRLKGLERTEIRSSSILLPAGFPENIASSLNHAITLFSKVYEKHRISNTGNVYKQVFYQERSGKWYPLGHLRRGVQAQGECTLLDSTWQEIKRALGLQPAGEEPQK